MKKILTIILLFIGFTSYGQLVTNKGITIDSISGVANNWVTQYQRKKTSDSLQANINTNTTALGNKWGITGNSGTSYINFLGTTDNVTQRFRTNNIERAAFDSVGNFVFGKNSMIIGQQAIDPANQRSTQYASDGSYPATLQLVTTDSIGCVNCTVNGTNITSDSTKSQGLEISAYTENTGGAFIHFKKARGNFATPRGVRTNDILGGIAAWGYLGDQANFSGSPVGFHFVAVNNFTAAQQSTGMQFFVNNVNARKYAFYVQPTGKTVFYDSTGSVWNPVELGSLKSFGLIDNWNSDMVLGAQDNAITRGANTIKTMRIGMPTYIHNGSTINSQLLIGVNNSTDNIVYMGGGSAAYYGATQLNFYTASALATTTGTLAMRINSAQNILMSNGTDDGTASKLQVAGNESIVAGTLVDQKRALKITATMPGGTASSANVVQDIQATSSSNTQNQYAFNLDLLAGGTDAKIYAAGRFGNSVAGTGTNLVGLIGNYGVLGFTGATTVGYNTAVYGWANGGGNLNAGVVGRSITLKNAATNIGGAFFGRNTGTTPIQIGVYAGLNSADPTFASGALVVDNSDQTSPIALFRDNGTIVASIVDGGAMRIGDATGATDKLEVTGNIALTTAGNKIKITEGSNGSVGQTTLVSGTKAITITGLATSSRAQVTFVSIGGTVTTTWQYAAVCTANTLTITALTTAGATNTTDTSVLNYWIVN